MEQKSFKLFYNEGSKVNQKDLDQLLENDWEIIDISEIEENSEGYYPYSIITLERKK